MKQMTIRCAFALLLAVSAYADCVGSSVDAPVARALLDAPSIDRLDRAYENADSRDAALRALYRHLRLTLNPSAAEEMRFVRGLPTSEAELNRVYALVDTHGLCDNPLVQEVVYGMFDTAARVIVHRRTGYRGFIRLCLWSNAEVGEIAWPAYDSLLDEEPRFVIAALRSLGREERMRVCDGVDPRLISDVVAEQRCRSGL